MVKVVILHDDIFSYRLMDSKEVIEMFGEDYLEDYGIKAPVELLNKYLEVIKEYNLIQQELKYYYKKQREEI